MNFSVVCTCDWVVHKYRHVGVAAVHSDLAALLAECASEASGTVARDPFIKLLTHSPVLTGFVVTHQVGNLNRIKGRFHSRVAIKSGLDPCEHFHYASCPSTRIDKVNYQTIPLPKQTEERGSFSLPPTMGVNFMV